MIEQKQKLPVSQSRAKDYAIKVLEQTPDCHVTDIRFIGGGSFGFVFRAAIDCAPYSVIMKGCRTMGICAREANELTLLGKNSLIKLPQVYFTFLATDDIPMDFICMEVVEGRNCFTDPSKLLHTKKTKAQFADEITSCMRRWHEQTNDRFGLLDNAVYDTWLDYYRPFASDVLTCARTLVQERKLEKKVLDAMEHAWKAFDFIFSEQVETASLIHGDLNVMNILADNHLKPLAIIDPLESKWADREYDLFQLRNMTGDCFHLYDTYKAKYPVSEKCDLKTAFYALYHEVYAYIISGTKTNALLMPLVRRMKRELKKWMG